MGAQIYEVPPNSVPLHGPSATSQGPGAKGEAEAISAPPTPPAACPKDSIEPEVASKRVHKGDTSRRIYGAFKLLADLSFLIPPHVHGFAVYVPQWIGSSRDIHKILTDGELGMAEKGARLLDNVLRSLPVIGSAWDLLTGTVSIRLEDFTDGDAARKALAGLPKSGASGRAWMSKFLPDDLQDKFSRAASAALKELKSGVPQTSSELPAV